jgi:hypothetical protein
VNPSVGTPADTRDSGGTIIATNNVGIAGATHNLTGDSFFMIDNKIKTEIVETDCAVPGTTTKYRTVPTNGGYGVIIRNIEYSSIDVTLPLSDLTRNRPILRFPSTYCTEL